MIISFPRFGDYHIPLAMMLRRIFPQAQVLPPTPITARTIELGARHSPDTVCMPFKYNLGSYIEALERGADVLMGAGAGCRYGFYGETHELILRGLGYKFDYINFFEMDGSIINVYKLCKRLGSPLSLLRFLMTARLIIKTLAAMDETDFYIREHSGLEAAPGNFDRLKTRFLLDLEADKHGERASALAKLYKQNIAAVPLTEPKKAPRAGLVGELFSLIEPSAQHSIERALTDNGITVTRRTNLTYLLFQKRKHIPRLLREAEGYIEHHLGADATGTVANALEFAKAGYDGIIHLKPFGCTPELNAIPFLERISRDYDIPILYFSFDTQTTPTGVGTRLEAFVDMIKEKNYK